MLTIRTTTAREAIGSEITSPYWIDLLNPTAEEAARMAAQYAIEVPSRDSLREIESSSRLRSAGQVLYVNMPLTAQDDAAGLAPLPLGFILSPHLLVTVRFSEIPAFVEVHKRVSADSEMTSSMAFTALIEGMVDTSADMLEKLGSNLAVLAEGVFGRNGVSPAPDKRFTRTLRDSLNAVGTAGETRSRIRDSVLGLQRILGYVSEMAAEWLPSDLKTRLKTARQDLVSLVDFEEHLAGKTQFILDATLGFISTEQNDIFKVLTIVSVVGVPPTLIASMYGMNFHTMPELGWRWGYPYALVLIVFSIVLPILWFKRRGWW